MDKRKDPGALAGATGASGTVSTDKPDHTAHSVSPQVPLIDLTDDGLATMFVDRIRERARYFVGRRHWLLFDGAVWCHDATDAVFDEARMMLRELRIRFPGSASERLGRLSTINAVLRIARTDSALRIGWDGYAELMRGGQ